MLSTKAASTEDAANPGAAVRISRTTRVLHSVSQKQTLVRLELHVPPTLIVSQTFAILMLESAHVTRKRVMDALET